MRIAVKDACVLIDLANGGLIAKWFQLQIETHTTDAVLFEVEDEAQRAEVMAFVEAGLIHVAPMYEAGSFEALQSLADAAADLGVSGPDASAYILADRLGAVLLTGDGGLRREAATRGVAVCGVLWIIDMLLWKDVIAFEAASASLRQMLERGARLPKVECERRCSAWADGRKIRPRQV